MMFELVSTEGNKPMLFSEHHVQDRRQPLSLMEFAAWTGRAVTVSTPKLLRLFVPRLI